MLKCHYTSREVAQIGRALAWGARGRWGGTSLPDLEVAAYYSLLLKGQAFKWSPTLDLQKVLETVE